MIETGKAETISVNLSPNRRNNAIVVNGNDITSTVRNISVSSQSSSGKPEVHLDLLVKNVEFTVEGKVIVDDVLIPNDMACQIYQRLAEILESKKTGA